MVIDFDSLPANQALASPLDQGDYRFASVGGFGPTAQDLLITRGSSGTTAIQPANFFSPIFQRLWVERADGAPFFVASFDVFPVSTSSIDPDPFVGGTPITLTLTDALAGPHVFDLLYPGHVRGATVPSTRFTVDFGALGVDYPVTLVDIFASNIRRYQLQYDNFALASTTANPPATSVPEPSSWALMFVGLLALASRRGVARRAANAA